MYLISLLTSPSMGAMARHMMRVAFTERTLGLSEPSPVDFYSFWKTFNWKGLDDSPADYIESKKASNAQLSHRTSTFNFFQSDSEVTSVKSANKLDNDSDAATSTVPTKVPGTSVVAAKQETNGEMRLIREAWRQLVRSYSDDSLVYPSTRSNSFYEPAMREGFSDEWENDNTDSDADLFEKMQLLYGHKPETSAEEESIESSVRGDDNEKIRAARRKAAAAAIASAKVEQDRIAQEEANEKAEREAEYDYIIKHGSRDSFLKYDFGDYADNILEADYLIERSSDESFSSEEAEIENETRANSKKNKSKKSCKLHPKLDPAVKAAKKMEIEKKLREAVKCRSAMGTYIPPKGSKPLTKYFDSSSPGPAAYYPVQKMSVGAILTSRWNDKYYESLGPGPGTYFADKNQHTMQMYNLHESERFETSTTVGPGPGVVNISPAGHTGKDKPHALILSRRSAKKVGCGDGQFTNCYGLTRRGKARPPNALIISKHPLKDKSVPGPGAYDTPELPDSHVGIILKSRIPAPGPGINPGFLALPDVMEDGPAFTFGIRKFKIQNEDSPGPIYKIPLPKKKPISLTFKPFTPRGKQNEPGPTEYGDRVGKAGIKVRPTAPVAVLTGRNYPNFGTDELPGPNHYNIRKHLGADGPSLSGRFKTKTSVEPGPADFVPNNKHFRRGPRPVFQHRHREKPLKENSPGFIYTPKYENRVLGGKLYGRWNTAVKKEHAPEFLDLFGYTRYGPQSKIPLSLKSRHTRFKHNALSLHAQNACNNSTNP